MKFPKNIKSWKFAKNCQKCPFWILEKIWKNFNFFNKFFWIFWPLKRYVVLQWKLQKWRVIFSNMRTAHYMSKWHVIFAKTTCRFVLTTTTSWCRERHVIFFPGNTKTTCRTSVIFNLQKLFFWPILQPDSLVQKQSFIHQNEWFQILNC